MRRPLLAAAALCSFASLANAADLPPLTYDWSGFYAGLNAGVGFNNSSLDNDFEYTGGSDIGPYEDVIDGFGDALTGDDTGFSGGAMLGYNWQSGSLVLGAEADINYVGLGGSDTVDRGALFDSAFGEPPGTIDASHKLSYDGDWFGTLRGRLGFAQDNLLLFATGGLAYGHMSVDSTLEASSGAESGIWKGSADSVNWGWTAGFGMEYGMERWTLGVEYLFVDLGTADWESDGDVDCCSPSVEQALREVEGDGEFDYQFSVIRATARLRF